MKELWVLLGVFALPLLAFAQAGVADPSVAVPPVTYRSVFPDTPKGVETRSVDWKAANAEVGQFRNGHADILKWEAGQGERKPEAPMPAHAPASGPAKP
jgi:hypothetical protein